MTVLHLLFSQRFSGAESVVCQIIRTMEPSYTMLYASPEGPIAETLAQRGITYVPLRKLSVAEVRRAVREYHVDLIHAHDMRACFVARMAVPRTPMVFHIHNNATDARRLSVKSLLFRFAARRAKHIFWVSQSAMSDYRFARAVKAKSSVLENIVDRRRLTEQAAAREEEAYHVVFLGRLTAVKDPLRFVSLMRRVADAYPALRCAMIGTGDMEDAVRLKIAELHLDAHVDMLGFCSNPYPYLSRASLMVMTSVYEGMPMAALEALTFGVPIVATPVDGLVTLIGDGKGGVLSADDAVLSASVLHFLTDPSARAKAAEEAAAIAARHNDAQVYYAELNTAYKHA